MAWWQQQSGNDPTEAPISDKSDNGLSEIERRLEFARYYRLLLEHDFFTDATLIGQAVTDELRQFVRERLNVLLGVQTEATKIAEVFSADEIGALRILAARLLGRTAVVPVAGPAPVVPAIRTISLSAPKTSNPPSPSFVRPVANPGVATVPVVSTASRGKPGPKPGSRRLNEKNKPTDKPSVKLDQPQSSESPLVLAVARIEEAIVDSYPLETKVVVQDKLYKVVEGTAGKKQWRDITPAARPTGAMPVPMPSPEVAEAHQTAQAHEIMVGADRALRAGRNIGVSDA